MKSALPRTPEPDLDERSGYFSILKPADAPPRMRRRFLQRQFPQLGQRLDARPAALRTDRRRPRDRRTGPDGAAARLAAGRRASIPISTPATRMFPRKASIDGASASRPGSVTPFDTDDAVRGFVPQPDPVQQHQQGPRLRRAPPRRRRAQAGVGQILRRIQCARQGLQRGRLPRAGPTCAAITRRLQAGGQHPAPQRGGAHRADVLPHRARRRRRQPVWRGVARAAQVRRAGQIRRAAVCAQPTTRAPNGTRSNGVLAANPDGAAGAQSGTINYINQLGRADAARLGAYKSADPGAELYYEAPALPAGPRRLRSRGAGSDAGFRSGASAPTR